MERQSRLGEGPARATDPFQLAGGFVEHPYLVPRMVEAREYQVALARLALGQNTLIVLPTGLGKTIVAVLTIAETLRNRRGTILLVAPTRPLALQHYETMKRLLRDEGLIHLFSGEVPAARRAELWGKGILVVATPQTIQNDLAEGRYDLSNVGLLVFDEAHRSVGVYAYVEIAERLRRDRPDARILGLTASPGAKRERVQEVAQNLGIELIEAREATSGDVVPYVQKVVVEEVRVKLTPMLRSLQQEFQTVLSEQEAKLRQYGVVFGERPYGVTKRELVLVIRSRGRAKGAGAGPTNFAALQVAQKALYATICLEYLETQGLVPLLRYLQRMFAKEEPKRAEKAFMKEPRVAKVFERLSKGIESSHPKVDELVRLLSALLARRPDALALVFAQYRDTVAHLAEVVEGRGFKVGKLFGQANRGDEKGLTQAEQGERLERFGRREFNVLFSTSIGEEGLDVPQVDLVVFYEAVPSEIRAVQRRGRTGRTVAGRVVVLISEGTRDEAFLRAQTSREAKMKRLIGRYA